MTGPLSHLPCPQRALPHVEIHFSSTNQGPQRSNLGKNTGMRLRHFLLCGFLCKYILLLFIVFLLLFLHCDLCYLFYFKHINPFLSFPFLSTKQVGVWKRGWSRGHTGPRIGCQDPNVVSRASTSGARGAGSGSHKRLVTFRGIE